MLALLIATPVLFGLLLYSAKTQRIIAPVARIGSCAVMAVSVAFCAQNFNTILVVDLSPYSWIKYVVLLLEAAMAAYLIGVALKNRSILLGVMCLAQIVTMAVFELTHNGGPVRETLIVDKLSLLMIAIAGVIGGLICIYAIEYMKDYHRHHPEIEDRRGLFFTILFFFLAAMFGLVIANEMTLVLFCWEVTSLASFLLIGYSRTREAAANSLLAIVINVFGGLMFTIGIVLAGTYDHTVDFNSFLKGGNTPVAGIAVFLFACAALTKSAQFPFAKWLLGAMVAPTPTSAMLHSSTMVKAGVYLLLRMASMLGSNPAGIAVTVIGGVTFLIAALMAVSQEDAKRVLAYSTVSNLGLIVACAGIDTAESLWAAIMLTVFHAIAKSLLFLSVGSTEHQLGSRDIEDMDGLIRISSHLTMFLIVGIAGMFMAPFGMLISKWAAMKALLDSKNAVTVIMLAFGSTVTLFFWTKWMGKLVANAHRSPPTSYIMRIDEKISLYALAAMVVGVCLVHPALSLYVVEPYIHENQFINFTSPINPTASSITIFMLGTLFVLPLVLVPIYRKFTRRRALVYMSGENAGDNESFFTGAGAAYRLETRNWYMRGMFREDLLARTGVIIGIVTLLAGFFAIAGSFAI